MASVNPFRFSTQYQGDETDLVMYPARPYNPSTGRFLCKDPIEEAGGVNLYACAGNDLVDFVDPLGLYTPVWLGTTVGVKNSGGMIGGYTLGATAVSVSINKLKTSVKNCKCCLDELDLKMSMKVYVVGIGDKFKFGWPGGWEVTVDSDIQNHNIAHEQVHVNVAWKGFGKLFPKIESDCTGKCFSKPWFSSWTASSCHAKWESVIKGEMKWVGSKINKLNNRWHDYDPEIFFRGPIADPAPFYKEMDAELNEWSKHKFCAPGFFSGDPH